MKNNLIGAIAGWKSAALLALVAMVAAVAFSGVLTNTESAKAQAEPDAKIEQGDATVTVPLTASSATEPAVDSTVDGHKIITDGTTPATAAVALDTGETAGEGAKYTLTITIPDLLRGTVPLGKYTYGISNASVTSVTVEVIARQAVPGETVTVVIADATAADTVFRISADSTASGSFVANPGRSFIICDDHTSSAASACDADEDTDATADGVQKPDSNGNVFLQVKVAADSSKGTIFITQGTDVTTERAIQVSPAPVATGLTVAGAAPGPVGLSQSSDEPGETITVTVTNNRGAVVPGQSVRLTTTLGQFTGCGVEIPLPVCSVTTGPEGTKSVTLKGDNRSGSATVTATAGTLTRTLAVTFFGLADSLTAAAAGGVATVDQGKMGYVFLTITDEGGNAVEGSTPGASVTTEIENPTVVDVVNTVAYEGTPSPADNVPACSDGTNVAGQCAVQISAGPTASRGIHTVAASMTVVTATGPKVLSDSIDIRVVGAPASIETDAPDSVEPRTTVTINVSVSDDNGDLVGGGTVKVVKLQGQGAVLGTTDNAATLVGGKGSFRYYATSTDTAAVFELTAGAGPAAVTEIVEIVVSADAGMGDDDMSMATWNNDLVSGQNLVVWNGADGAGASAGAADGVSAIWAYNTGSGSWDGYFPDAADVPGGNTLTSLSNGQAYFVIVD